MVIHMKKSQFEEIKKLAKHDITAGVYKNRWKYLLCIPLVCIFFFNYCEQVNGFFENAPHAFEPSFMDFMLYVFKGKIFIFIDNRTRYEIPFMWLTTQMMALYIVGSYASDDRTRTGQQYLLRCTHTSSWYIGKLFYSIVSVGLFYLEICILGFLFTVPFSKQVFTLHSDLILMSTNIHIERHTQLDIYRSVFVMPCLTAMVLGQMFIVLQLVIKPSYSYIASLFYILCSDYYPSSFLIGNYSMIVRNVQENTEHGEVLTKCFDPVSGILLEISISILLIFLGKLILKKYDYLERE